MTGENEEVVEGTAIEGAEEGGEGTPAAATIPQETIDYARAQGWVPREEFRGPADKWVDADEFAERATQINGIVNANNKRLKDELAQTKSELQQIREDASKAIEFARKAERARYEEQLTALKAEKAAAISDGDGARVLEIETRMDQLPKPEEAPAAKKLDAPSIPEAVKAAGDAFIERNPWFAEGEQHDPVKTELVLAVAKAIRLENPNAVQSPSYFTEIEKRLQTRYPSIFGKKTPPVLSENGGTPGGATKTSVKRGYADLPPDAKKVADRYEANNWLKKEEYAKQYWAEEQGSAQ